MKKTMVSYISVMTVMFIMMALFQSELALIIGSVIFAMMCIAMPVWLISVMSLIACVIFAFISSTPVAGAIIAAGFILPGIAEGIALRKKAGFSAMLVSGALVRLATSVGYYYYASRVMNTTIKSMVVGDFPKALEQYASEAGISADPELIRQNAELMGQLLPSVIGILALAFAFFTLVGIKLMLKRMPIETKWLRRFEDIKMDWSVTVFTVIIGVCVFLTTGAVQLIALNALYVLLAVYTVAGIAALSRLVRHMTDKRALKILIVIAAGLLTAGVVYPVAGAVGSFAGKE